jgi:hypothetical protein
LASLGGKQPRVLPLARIREIESYLEAAVHSGACPEASLLWAIIKYDYYRANGLRVPPPSIEELLENAPRGTRPEARLIAKHINVPASLRRDLTQSIIDSQN